MKEKTKILIFCFIAFGYILGAQNSDLLKLKPGECYLKCTTKKGKTTWTPIKCEYLNQDVKVLQIKLKNLGYEVDLTEEMDLKTYTAFKQYLKHEKKEATVKTKAKRQKKKKKIKKQKLKKTKNKTQNYP